MSWRDYLALGGLGLLIMLVVGIFQTTPGYMDAEYYFMGGMRLAGGHGFTEPVVWNFLDDPQGLPHASHTYWMPLASILTWSGMALSRSDSFAAGRAGFLIVASMIPPLTSALAYRLISRRGAAWLAGLLAVFPAFYLPYLPTTDTFALVMLCGTCWLWLAAGYPVSIGRCRLEGEKFASARAISLGIISGLMHLTRADGLVWLLLALGTIVIWRDDSHASVPETGNHAYNTQPAWKPVILRLSFCLLGYLIVMAPWLARNLAVLGSPLAPGGSKALWFIDYDDLYLYPASTLTAQRWWSSGVVHIFTTRLWALGQNLQTFLAVQGMIVLVPLILWGLWRCRCERAVKIGLVSWLLILLIMTAPFPFAGARGGFFHSGAALQPLIWAVVPVGMQGFIEWGTRKRGWVAPRAGRVFGISLVVLAAILSAVIVSGRVLGSDWRRPVWGASDRQYRFLGEELKAAGAAPQDVVLVNNPPGFFLATGRPAVSIPDGGSDSLLAVADEYHARYIILESNHPPGLNNLFQQPEGDHDLRYIKTISGAHVFEIQRD